MIATPPDICFDQGVGQPYKKGRIVAGTKEIKRSDHLLCEIESLDTQVSIHQNNLVSSKSLRSEAFTSSDVESDVSSICSEEEQDDDEIFLCTPLSTMCRDGKTATSLTPITIKSTSVDKTNLAPKHSQAFSRDLLLDPPLPSNLFTLPSFPPRFTTNGTNRKCRSTSSNFP